MYMLIMILRRIFTILLILPSLALASLEFADREHRKQFVLALETPGDLTLELRKEYQGKQGAELMFIYDKARMRWERKGDLVELYRLSSYPKQGGEEELAFVLRYDSDAQVLRFEPKGVLGNSEYFEFFTDKVWLPANDRKDSGYKRFYKSREQPRRFYEIKSKGSFPDNTPSVLMNIAARLFRDRVHELRAPLLYPGLDEVTLRLVAESMLNEEYGQSYLHQPLVAAHPNTAKDLRDEFFASNGHNKLQVWRAVALRDDEPEARYQEYLRRIREGEQRDRHMVARDSEAPREAWMLAVAPGERDVLKEFSRNPNAPPDMIIELFESGALTHDARGMASNEQTPPTILDALSNTDERQILWALQRNLSTPGATIQKILAYFGGNESADLRGHAARDERTPVELLEVLARDVNTNVRTGVANNQGAPIHLLEQLAKDSHQTPAICARENLRRNHNPVYKGKKDSWTPSDQLNPHNNLSQEFVAAVKAGDQDAARNLITFTDDPETRLKDMDILWPIQNHDFEGFKAIFKETLLRMEPKFRLSIFKREQATAEQLSWAIREGFLESGSIPSSVEQYTKKGRADLIMVLEEAGLLKAIDKQTATVGLFMAVLTRNVELVELWLSKGGDPSYQMPQGMCAIEAAKRFHMLSVLERIDQKGRHKKFIKNLRREFPVPKNLDYVGGWSNRKDGFYESSMSLFEDGTGSLGATMVLVPFLWKEVGENQIEFAMVNPESGELVEERIQFVITDQAMEFPYEKRSGLMLKAVGENQTYYKIPEKK